MVNNRRLAVESMTLDEAILRALEDGPATVSDIIKRFDKPVREKLERLRVRGALRREGRGGAHREFTFTLLCPDRAAKALSGNRDRVSRAAISETPPAQQELLLALIARAAGKRRLTSFKTRRHYFLRRHKREQS
jgi:hypothetical protein